MNDLFTKIEQLDPMLAVSAVLIFACGLKVGQQTKSREAEVVENNPYKNLTLDKCTTDYECNIAQLIADNRDGKLVRTEDLS